MREPNLCPVYNTFNDRFIRVSPSVSVQGQLGTGTTGLALDPKLHADLMSFKRNHAVDTIDWTPQATDHIMRIDSVTNTVPTE